MCEGSKSFLRDVAVNLVGVLIAAGISIVIAFWIYDYRNQKQCDSILEMVIEEQKINETNSKIILSFLAPISTHKKPDKISLQTFYNRLQIKSTNIASESDLVMRFTPSELRTDIITHWENLNNLNESISGFNNFITMSRASSQISHSYVKQWAATLIETINKRSNDSKILSKKIRIYLNKQ